VSRVYRAAVHARQVALRDGLPRALA